jgi:predicted porin
MKKSMLLMVIPLFMFADPYYNNLTLDPDRLNKKESETSYDKTQHPLSVFFGIGGSYVDIISSVRDDKVLDGGLDDTGFSWELGLGVMLEEHIFATSFIQRSYLDRAEITNIGLGANYQFTNSHIGLLGGRTILQWDSSPVNNTLSSNKTQKQIFFGCELGYDYHIVNRLSIYTKYQLMFLNHQSDINDNTAIKHSIQNNLTTGVKYAF